MFTYQGRWEDCIHILDSHWILFYNRTGICLHNRISGQASQNRNRMTSRPQYNATLQGITHVCNFKFQSR